MAKFSLEIDSRNAAFEEDPALEVARILKEVAAKLESNRLMPEFFGHTRDLNGNTVGKWDYDAEKEDE